MFRTLPFCLLLTFLFSSCNTTSKMENFETSKVLYINDKYLNISVENLNDEVHRIKVDYSLGDSLISSRALILPYQIYQFDTGDIDLDGNPDVCLGVIKSCKFDPIIRKRLFIYSVEKESLHPLWLGTYLGDELQNFRITSFQGRAIIRTLEIDNDENYLVRNYRWISFGPEFINNSYKGQDHDQAERVFIRNRL